ncbi:MAG: sel1 repeat family protein [Prevotella sp.]|nr:sel1 repeat family protein [Prevotella sp.]
MKKFLILLSIIAVFPLSLLAEDDATITWMNYKEDVEASTLNLKWAIKAKSQIVEVTITLNGNTIKGLSAVNNDGYDMIQSRTVILKKGVNDIEIAVKTVNGLTISQKSIKCGNDNDENEESLQNLFDEAYNDNPEAQYTLGMYYLEGKNGVEKDLFESSLWFKKSSELGYANSQYEFAISLMEARGILKDIPFAISLLEEASEQNNPQALFKLGLCYENGIGVSKNIDKAKELYKRCPLDEAKQRLIDLEK